MTNPASSLSTYVFIIGNCAEWEEDRAEMGDKQLHQCFLQYGIPTENMTFVLDDDCTKQSCERDLEQLLLRTQPKDTLVFFYGGHGVTKGFNTIGKVWRYSDAIQTIEDNFRGDKVWCLIDCCFSGSFDYHIPPETTKTWLCLMSSDASIEAGEDWTMTDCFSKAMRGRLLRQPSSTSGDKLSKDDKNDDALTTQDMVEVMADHHAIIKNDCLQATLHGNAIDPRALFPFRISDERMKKKVPNVMGLFISSLLLRKTDAGAVVTNESDYGVVADPIKWKRMMGLTKGDRIYAKWCGGSPPLVIGGGSGANSSNAYLFPAWYHATLVSDVLDYNTMEPVEVEFQHDGHRWTRLVSYQYDVLPASYVEIVFKDYCKAHKKLAQYGRYLDGTVKAGTKMWAFYEEDGKVYTAYIQQDNDREWQYIKNRVMDRAMYLPYYGPFLWAEWEGEDDWTLLPKSHCIISESLTQEIPTIQQLRQQARQPTDHTLTAKQAMRLGMESMNKELILPQAPHQKLSCYWDGAWYPAFTTGKVPSACVLAHHLHFENITGKYYCVKWEKDGQLALLPERLMRIVSNEKELSEE